MPVSRIVQIAFTKEHSQMVVSGNSATKGGDPFLLLRSLHVRTTKGLRNVDVTYTVDSQKEAYLPACLSNQVLSTEVLYKSLQPEYDLMHTICPLFRVLPMEGLVADSNVVAMGCMWTLAVYSDPNRG